MLSNRNRRIVSDLLILRISRPPEKLGCPMVAICKDSIASEELFVSGQATRLRINGSSNRLQQVVIVTVQVT
jgi:hypothetical protein